MCHIFFTYLRLSLLFISITGLKGEFIGSAHFYDLENPREEHQLLSSEPEGIMGTEPLILDPSPVVSTMPISSTPSNKVIMTVTATRIGASRYFQSGDLPTTSLNPKITSSEGISDYRSFSQILANDSVSPSASEADNRGNEDLSEETKPSGFAEEESSGTITFLEQHLKDRTEASPEEMDQASGLNSMETLILPENAQNATNKNDPGSLNGLNNETEPNFVEKKQEPMTGMDETTLSTVNEMSLPKEIEMSGSINSTEYPGDNAEPEKLNFWGQTSGEQLPSPNALVAFKETSQAGLESELTEAFKPKNTRFVSKRRRKRPGPGGRRKVRMRIRKVKPNKSTRTSKVNATETTNMAARVLRRYRSTTTPPNLIHPDPSPPTILPESSNKSKMITKTRKTESDAQKEGMTPGPQIERPLNIYPENMNLHSEPSESSPPEPDSNPGTSTNSSVTKESAEWLHSSNSRHHAIHADQRVENFGKQRDSWEKNYMNLQQNSFYRSSPEVISGEETLASLNKNKGEEYRKPAQAAQTASEERAQNEEAVLQIQVGDSHAIHFEDHGSDPNHDIYRARDQNHNNGMVERKVRIGNIPTGESPESVLIRHASPHLEFPTGNQGIVEPRPSHELEIISTPQHGIPNYQTHQATLPQNPIPIHNPSERKMPYQRSHYDRTKHGFKKIDSTFYSSELAHPPKISGESEYSRYTDPTPHVQNGGFPPSTSQHSSPNSQPDNSGRVPFGSQKLFDFGGGKHFDPEKIYIEFNPGNIHGGERGDPSSVPNHVIPFHSKEGDDFRAREESGNRGSSIPNPFHYQLMNSNPLKFRKRQKGKPYQSKPRLPSIEEIHSTNEQELLDRNLIKNLPNFKIVERPGSTSLESKHIGLSYRELEDEFFNNIPPPANLHPTQRETGSHSGFQSNPQSYKPHFHGNSPPKPDPIKYDDFSKLGAGSGKVIQNLPKLEHSRGHDIPPFVSMHPGTSYRELEKAFYNNLAQSTSPPRRGDGSRPEILAHSPSYTPQIFLSSDPKLESLKSSTFSKGHHGFLGPSPSITLPMPGLVSIPTPPPESHALNSVYSNRHYPPHTHSMSVNPDYEPANPPLLKGHPLQYHFDPFIQNAGDFPEEENRKRHPKIKSLSKIKKSSRYKGRPRKKSRHHSFIASQPPSSLYDNVVDDLFQPNLVKKKRKRRPKNRHPKLIETPASYGNSYSSEERHPFKGGNGKRRILPTRISPAALYRIHKAQGRRHSNQLKKTPHKTDPPGSHIFSESAYVLMFPKIVPESAMLPVKPLINGKQIPVLSASDPALLKKALRAGASPGYHPTQVHPREQMLQVLASTHYEKEMKEYLERKRSPPLPIHTPYGLLVPMGPQAPQNREIETGSSNYMFQRGSKKMSTPHSSAAEELELNLENFSGLDENIEVIDYPPQFIGVVEHDSPYQGQEGSFSEYKPIKASSQSESFPIGKSSEKVEKKSEGELKSLVKTLLKEHLHEMLADVVEEEREKITKSRSNQKKKSKMETASSLASYKFLPPPPSLAQILRMRNEAPPPPFVEPQNGFFQRIKRFFSFGRTKTEPNLAQNMTPVRPHLPLPTSSRRNRTLDFGWIPKKRMRDSIGEISKHPNRSEKERGGKERIPLGESKEKRWTSKKGQGFEERRPLQKLLKLLFRKERRKKLGPNQVMQNLKEVPRILVTRNQFFTTRRPPFIPSPSIEEIDWTPVPFPPQRRLQDFEEIEDQIQSETRSSGRRQVKPPLPLKPQPRPQINQIQNSILDFDAYTEIQKNKEEMKYLFQKELEMKKDFTKFQKQILGITTSREETSTSDDN